MLATFRNLSAILAAALLTAAPAGAWQQAAPPVDELAPLAAEAEPPSELESELAAALDLFGSAAQPDSIAAFTAIIDRLRVAALERPLTGIEERALASSLYHRAEARFNLGENEGTEEDLRALYALEPGFQFDRSLISPKLVELLDRLRSELVADLELAVTPADARLSVDGVASDWVSGPVALAAGKRSVTLSRPGHDPVTLELELLGGESRPLEVTLDRTSAVVRVEVSPPGAELFVDGEPAAGGSPAVLEGLTPGQHVVEARLAGYRTERRTVSLTELADYALEPIQLTEARGVIRLSSVPEGARVTVDDERVPPGTGSLTLAPGAHRVEVRAGTLGSYARTVELADGDALAVDVALEPTLALVAVLGGDQTAAEKLRGRLAESLGALEKWDGWDASARGRETAARLGLQASALRGRSGTDLREEDATRIQTAFDREIASSSYLVAVLDDDLYATHAELWLWAAAPGPLRPAVRTIALAESGELEGWIAAVERSVPAPRAWLGAQLIDSAGGPLVWAVEPDGPAAEAGLARGQRLVAIDGAPAVSRRAVLDRLAAEAPGAEVELGVAAGDAATTVRLTLGASPAIVGRTDPLALDPALFAAANAALTHASPATPLWVLRLNLADLMIRDGRWPEAVRILRSSEAPERPGLGRAAADYWLAIALLANDPVAYAAPAREALERASRIEGGRLNHNDGPLLAPRIRTRLRELEHAAGR